MLVLLRILYCACTPCTVFWHGQHGQCSYLPAFVLVLCLYRCTVCTVLVPLVQYSGMASKGNVPILKVFVLVLWLYHCTVCTVLVPLVQCSGMASTVDVPILPVFVGDRGLLIFPVQLTTSRIGNLTRLIHNLLYVRTIHTYILWLYHCIVCTVLVPLVQWFSMASTVNVPILPVFVLVLWLYLLYSVLAWPARLMCRSYSCLYCTVRIPLHSVCCACTPCTRVCVCFLLIHSGHQVRWTYQPGSHRRKVTQDFSSTFLLRCVP